MATYKIKMTLNSDEMAALDAMIDAAITSAKVHRNLPVTQNVPALMAAYDGKLSTLRALKNKINIVTAII